MKVALIKVSEKNAFKEYKKYMAAPPQSIFSVAACTPEEIEFELVDETVDMKINYRTKADIIALFFSTDSAPRAYEIAQKFKEKGKTVVFGGLHPSFMPEEAIKYGDAVMIGEQEGIWEELIRDYQNGNLKRFYERSEPFDLNEMKPFPEKVIKKGVKIYGYWNIIVSRGCNLGVHFAPFRGFSKVKYDTGLLNT
ncbi:cobalamin-dependent protein [Archaeoglobus sp.]|uniref:cobalamin-dependent protein n=1 Tax=Archaeoglobus sp. TaxID=1872626 RepID=UPI0024AB5D0E|nr:cobalamin-dependent protein [Archaeoglobus sp.]MDI3496693.1 hypothetical protein [Archaeoglobus sp.]